MPKTFRIDGLFNSEWIPLVYVSNNHQRLVRFTVHRLLEGVGYTLDENWGASESKYFAFYVD